MKRTYSRSDEEGLAMPQPRAVPLHERANDRFSHNRRPSSIGTSNSPFGGLMAYRAPRRLAMWVALVLAACILGSIARAALMGGVEYVHEEAVVGADEDVLCDGLPPFVVVVDAGSTGCRAQAFRVAPGATASAFALEPAGKRVKLDTPLASLAGKSEDEVADVIVPMLHEISSRVPASDIASTPVYVWATAGARALSDAQQLQLWTTVTEVVRSRTDFALPTEGSASEKNHFRTVSGTEEGYFAWLAANVVSGVDLTRVGSDDAPDESETVGALDVGGGSAQFVALLSTSGASGYGPKRIRASSLDDLASGVYVKSYSGVGAAHAENRARKEAAAVAQSNGTYETTFACGFKGEVKETDGVKVTGTGDFDACLSLIREGTKKRLREDGEAAPFAMTAPLAALLGTDDGKPDEVKDPSSVSNANSTGGGRRFLGMSLLFHATNFLRVAFPEALASFPKPSLREIASAGRIACAAEWTTVLSTLDGLDENTPTARLPGRCFDAALVVALLGDEGGFGFGDAETRVEFVDDVDGKDVEWTMGAALSLVHRASLHAAGKDTALGCSAAAPNAGAGRRIGSSEAATEGVSRKRAGRSVKHRVRRWAGFVAAFGSVTALVFALAAAVEADALWRLTKPAERGIGMMGPGIGNAERSRKRGSVASM
jgi:hypothetical protein